MKTTSNKAIAIFIALSLLITYLFILTSVNADGPAAVNLRTAGDFAILSEAGITNTGGTLIEGDIGVSPIAHGAITGFTLILDSSGQFATSTLVDGKVYAADYADPTPAKMTQAVSDMGTAYTYAAGVSPDVTNLGGGAIGGLDLIPGCYKWTTGVTISSDVTLSGGSDDVWIFQISGTLGISSATSVILNGSINPDNIFWQTTGQVTLGTTSVFYGNILSYTAIVIQTGASLDGRALAQTAVTLDDNDITMPFDEEDLPNIEGFTPLPKDVTVGDSFRLDIYGEITSEIDVISSDNMTFLPAGLINYTSVAKGNIFNDAYTVLWITPTGGSIRNDLGYVKNLLWGVLPDGAVNNTMKNAFNITWLAVRCGIVTVNITKGGTAREGVDPGTLKLTGIVNVHPKAPTGASSTMINSTAIHLEWTKQTGMDNTVIRYRTDHSPTNITDGQLAYNGTATSTNHTGLSAGQHLYYSIWGWNESGLYSLTYLTTDEMTNNPPALSNETPENNSIEISRMFTPISIDIADGDEDVMDWSIEVSNGDSSNGADNDITITCPLTTPLEFDEIITWWVNITDGYDTVRAVYIFTVESDHPPSQPINQQPTNNSPYESVYGEYLNVTAIDPDADTMSVSFYWGNGTFIHTVTSVTNNTKASIYLPDYINPDWLAHDTTYYWYVNITDSYAISTQSGTYNFHTSKAFDINENGDVDYLDASALVSVYGTTCQPGQIGSDINNDGEVTYLDASSFVSHYGDHYYP